MQCRQGGPTEPLDPSEEAVVADAVPRRRAEFASGRACAHRALAQLGLPHRPVLRGPKGEPVWPPGIVGSITHGGGFAAAAVAWSTDVGALGIDIERGSALDDRALRLVCTEEERSWVRSLPDRGVDWPTLVFSAKESTFKALSAATPRRLAFADVALDVDVGTGRFTPRVVGPDVSPGLLPTEGRFAVTEGLVVTAAWRPPDRR